MNRKIEIKENFAGKFKIYMPLLVNIEENRKKRRHFFI